MIKLENTVVPSVEQWQAVISGMRNPKNSWDLADSEYIGSPVCLDELARPSDSIYLITSPGSGVVILGDRDKKLMKTLSDAGSVHAKFRRMLTVLVDITAPLYWWKEFDTYKVGTVANSCSTMHKIHAKEFEPIDFSIDQLSKESLACISTTLAFLNENRRRYLALDDRIKYDKSIGLDERRELVLQKKEAWWQMIQLLPSSYNQKRTVMLSYEVLANILEYREGHPLDEWQVVCDWIKALPGSDIIITHR